MAKKVTKKTTTTKKATTVTTKKATATTKKATATTKKATATTKKDISIKKNKGGKPTFPENEYKPEYCKRIINYFSRGMSQYEAAKELGVYRKIFPIWRRRYPEFDEAMEKGYDLCRAWWEKQGRYYLKPRKNIKGINVVLWIFNMKNRFNWCDRSEVNQSEKTESSIKLDLSDVSDAKLDSLESLPVRNIRKKLKLLNNATN